MVIVEKERDSASPLRSQLKLLRARDVFWRTLRLSAETCPSLLVEAGSSSIMIHRSSALSGDNNPEETKCHTLCPRCEENPFCKWFSYDDRQGLCYLKDRRGLLADSRSRFTSGATFRDGCAPDPPCDHHYLGQCVFSPPAPGSRVEAAARCESLGGSLVTTYEGWAGGSRGDMWHWVDTDHEAGAGQCWACRPAHWGLGVTSLPCSRALAFSCQRHQSHQVFPAPLISNDIEDTQDLRGIISNLIEIDRGFAVKKRLRNLSRRRKRRRHRYFANPFLNLAFG